MKKYKVINGVVNISGGVLSLDDGQSRPRMHKLKHISGNRYEVLHPVQFKGDEVIGYDGELPRTLTDNLELIETAKPKAEKKDPE